MTQNRRHCSACRFNKCIQVGMKRECIMSDEQIMKKVFSINESGHFEPFCLQRALIKKNRLRRQALAKPVLTDQEKQTIDTITASHSNSFDLTFGDMMNRKYGKSNVESSGKFISKFWTNSILTAQIQLLNCTEPQSPNKVKQG